jgi:hypothetical protein
MSIQISQQEVRLETSSAGFFFVSRYLNADYWKGKKAPTMDVKGWYRGTPPTTESVQVMLQWLEQNKATAPVWKPSQVARIIKTAPVVNRRTGCQRTTATPELLQVLEAEVQWSSRYEGYGNGVIEVPELLNKRFKVELRKSLISFTPQ